MEDDASNDSLVITCHSNDFTKPLPSNDSGRYKAKVKNYLTTDSVSVSLSWCQAIIRALPNFSFSMKFSFRQLLVCYFMAPSLTRGRVCNLLFLLGLVGAVPLGSESRGTQDHILLSQFVRFHQPRGPGLRICIPPGTGWPSYIPGQWIPFPSPLTTRRATVEIF
jgi:hypothetical protein